MGFPFALMSFHPPQALIALGWDSHGCGMLVLFSLLSVLWGGYEQGVGPEDCQGMA